MAETSNSLVTIPLRAKVFCHHDATNATFNPNDVIGPDLAANTTAFSRCRVAYGRERKFAVVQVRPDRQDPLFDHNLPWGSYLTWTALGREAVLPGHLGRFSFIEFQPVMSSEALHRDAVVIERLTHRALPDGSVDVDLGCNHRGVIVSCHLTLWNAQAIRVFETMPLFRVHFSSIGAED